MIPMRSTPRRTPAGTPREDSRFPSARSGSEIWVDPNRVGTGRRQSEEDLPRCACGAVLLFDATVCWKCHKRAQAEQAFGLATDEAFGLWNVGERQSAPDCGFVERVSMYDIPARSASEPLLCPPRGSAAPELDRASLEHFGTAAEWEAILEDNDRAYRELERCRFELQERNLELEEKDRIIRRLQARLEELEPQVPPRASRARCSIIGGEGLKAKLAELGRLPSPPPPGVAGGEEPEQPGAARPGLLAPRAARTRSSAVGGEARVAQLDLPGLAAPGGGSAAGPAWPGDARWPEQQPTPAFGFEKQFATELTEMASPSAWRRASTRTSFDSSDNDFATGLGEMTWNASSVRRASADSSEKQGWPTELTEITPSSAWKMSPDSCENHFETEMADMASPSLWRTAADDSEEEPGGAAARPVEGPPPEVAAGAARTYVGRLLLGSLARSAPRLGAPAAPELTTPDSGSGRACARGSLTSEVDRGAGTPSAHSMKASVRRLITDAVNGGVLESVVMETCAAATLVAPGARSLAASVRHPPASWLSGAAEEGATATLQADEVKLDARSKRASVPHLLTDAVDRGVLDRTVADDGAAAALHADEVAVDSRSLKASVRRLLLDAADGVLEGALGEKGATTTLQADEAEPDARSARASVRRLLTDAVERDVLERGLADDGADATLQAAEAELPPATPRARMRLLLVRSHRSGALLSELARLRPAAAAEVLAVGPPPSLPAASPEACLAKDHARELLGRDALDAGLERRLAQATVREEMAYRAALGECERLKAELAATVSAELGRAGFLGPERRAAEAVPSSPVALRTEHVPRGAVATAAAARRGAARGGLRGQVECVQEQAGAVFGEMERRCRRLQQELVEQTAIARGPPSGPTGAQDAPLVCELRRECERLRKDLAGAVLAERRAAGEAARLREQGRQMRGEWEHLRRELGGCLHQLGGRSPLHEPVCA